jgi:glucose/arabinose dehydrogenase
VAPPPPSRPARAASSSRVGLALALAAWLGLLLPGCAPTTSQAAPLDSAPLVTLEEVISDEPVSGDPVRVVGIAHAGDDRLFVVDANGRIIAYRLEANGTVTLLGTFLDIRDLVLCCGERGLLGLAFHPNYDAGNPVFFVYYTAKANDDEGLEAGDIVLARYQAPTADSNVADPDSAAILLKIEHSTYGNHNGGALAFGPDGYLYVGVGDGGSGGDPFNSGQTRDTLLGKVLRLDVDVPGDPSPHYEIPTNNPFVGTAHRPEIWAWGLRNPWRITFDRATGDLFIADVGQNSREEVNFQRASSPGGENYGWRRMEGIACYDPATGCQTGSLVLPILDYTHSEGCSVTGGYRYRGTRIPTLHGAYVFGDFCTKKIWIGTESGAGPWTRTLLLSTNVSISTFGEDWQGELYVANLDGGIHRFVPVRPKLTVTRSGKGGGTVNGPGGMSCAPVCSVEYDPGELVTLNAAVAGNSWFAGWSGACGGSGDCVVVMDGDRSVTAAMNLRPVLEFSAPTYSVSEGRTNARIRVRRVVSTAGTVSVDYVIQSGSQPGDATAPPAADADFSGPLTGTLTFTPGQSSKTFLVPIVTDTRAEVPETVQLQLENPTGEAMLGAQQTAVLTIVDNDKGGVLRWNSSAYSVNESAGQVVLTVRRSGGSASDVSVDYTIAGVSATAGADFSGPLTGTLQFGVGVSRQKLTIPVAADGEAEPNETFTVTLSNPQGGASVGSPSVATVTIKNSP